MGLIDKIKGLFHSSKKVWSEEEIFSVLNALRGETQDLMMTASVTDLEAKEYFAAKAKVLTEKINNAIEESSIARDTFKDIYEDVERDDDYRDEVIYHESEDVYDGIVNDCYTRYKNTERAVEQMVGLEQQVHQLRVHFIGEAAVKKEDAVMADKTQEEPQQAK